MVTTILTVCGVIGGVLFIAVAAIFGVVLLICSDKNTFH